MSLCNFVTVYNWHFLDFSAVLFDTNVLKALYHRRKIMKLCPSPSLTQFTTLSLPKLHFAQRCTVKFSSFVPISSKVDRTKKRVNARKTETVQEFLSDCDFQRLQISAWKVIIPTMQVNDGLSHTSCPILFQFQLILCLYMTTMLKYTYKS